MESPEQPNLATVFQDAATLIRGDTSKTQGPLLATAITGYNSNPTDLNYVLQASKIIEGAVNSPAEIGQDVVSHLTGQIAGKLNGLMDASSKGLQPLDGVTVTAQS